MDNKDRRKYKRFTTRLKVYDNDTGKLLGYIEDINIQGMSIRSKERLPDMQDINVWFGTDDENAGAEKIHLTVIKVWDAFTDSTPRFFQTGLHFVKSPEHALNLLQEMIYELQGDLVEAC